MASEDASTQLLRSTPSADLNIPRRYVPVEFVVVLYFISISCLNPLQQYYVMDAIAKEYNESGFINHGPAECKHSNHSTNKSRSVDVLIDEESSEVLMYLGICTTFLSVVPIIILGSVADRLGRKFVICLNLGGLLLKEIVNIVVIHFELPLNILYVGQVIDGLTGSFGAMLMALFGITADITAPGNHRAFRISVVEGVAAIVYSIGTLGIGYWINYGGFYFPMLFVCSTTVICIVFCALFIPETSVRRANNEVFFSRSYLFRSFRLYMDEVPSGRRWKLRTALLILSLAGAAIMGQSGTVILYLMKFPLCWNEVKVQVFSSVQSFVNWCAVIVLIRVLHNFTQDYVIIIIGSVSATLAFLVFSFTSHEWMVYLYTIVGLCSHSVFPATRSMMSRHCKPEEQGSLFASISSTELLFTALSQLLYGGVFKASVSFFPGLVFLIMTGILFMAVVMSLLLYKWVKQENRTQTWESIN